MKILDSMVEMVRVVYLAAARVARHDRDLAQQMKRASTSVALNGSEGLWAKAGKRRSRLEDAVNSARETLMAVRLSGACGYLPAAEAEALVGQVDSVIRVLWVLAYRSEPLSADLGLPLAATAPFGCISKQAGHRRSPTQRRSVGPNHVCARVGRS